VSIKRNSVGSPWRVSAFRLVFQLLAVAAGGYAAYRLALDIAIFNAGPPDLASKWMPLYRHGTAFSWLDRNPSLGFALSIITLIPSFAGMVLVWFRSRAGFLVAAAGWLLVTIVPLVHFYAGREGEPFETNWREITFITLPTLLFLFAAGTIRGATEGGRSN
jgi:hypothetical protein